MYLIRQNLIRSKKHGLMYLGHIFCVYTYRECGEKRPFELLIEKKSIFIKF